MNQIRVLMIKSIVTARNILFILGVISFWSCEHKETLKKYYDNGKLMAEVEMVDGKKNGRHIEYFENGDTMSVSHWKDWKINGKKSSYYPNGKIKTVSSWENDLQNGETRSYYENGNIESISHWKDDKSHGEGRIYYENGQLSEIYHRRNGILHGPFTWYYENGQLKAEGFFRDSVKVGVVKEYYDTGELLAENHFVNLKGKQTYTGGIEYNKDGSVKNESIRVDTKAEKDTINLGEELQLKITLRKPYFDKTKVIIGDYNYNFSVVDSSSLRTLEAINHEVIYKVQPKRHGENFVRGYVSNYRVIDKHKNITEESHTNFEFPYYVQ